MNELRATCRFFGPQRLQLKFQHRPTRMDCVSIHRPTADHGVQPIMMVVFDDDIAANHFLRVALEETEHMASMPHCWFPAKQPSNGRDRSGGLGSSRRGFMLMQGFP